MQNTSKALVSSHHTIEPLLANRPRAPIVFYLTTLSRSTRCLRYLQNSAASAHSLSACKSTRHNSVIPPFTRILLPNYLGKGWLSITYAATGAGGQKRQITSFFLALLIPNPLGHLHTHSSRLIPFFLGKGNIVKGSG